MRVARFSLIMVFLVGLMAISACSTGSRPSDQEYREPAQIIPWLESQPLIWV